jgi:CBS domain containing-hemolysin-like protein
LGEGASTFSLPLFLLVCGLLGLSAFFSAAETALFSLTRVDRRKLEEDRASLRAQLISGVLLRPRRVLSALLFGNTLVNVAISAAVAVFFERLFGVQRLAVTIVTGTLIVMFFGEVIPKTVAVNANRPIAFATILPLDTFARLSRPLVVIFDRAARLILRLLRVPEEARGAFSPSELELLFEEAGKEETITLRESEIARNIMRFSETTAEEIMTPRVDLVASPLDITREELERQMIEARHSRIPIYEGNVDSIVGFVSTKEILLKPESDLRDLLKPVAVFPEGARSHRVLHHMQRNRVNMAVIVNEYGETVGIVTMEDLVEEIVGEIHNEYEAAEALIRSVGPRDWLVQGRAAISDVNEAIGLALPDTDAVTLNGYLCDRFGEIPRAGRVLEEDGVRFTIVDSGRRIVSCRVEKLSSQAAHP